MKGYVLVFALLIAGSAFAFTIQVPEETVFVPIGSSRQLDIPLSSGAADDLSVTILETAPWITQSASLFKIEAGAQKILSIYLTPFIDTTVGVYKLTLLTQSLKTGEEQKKFVYVSVSKIEIVDIEQMTVAGNFTPNGNIVIAAVLRNYKPGIAENVKVITSVSSLSSKLVEFEQPIASIDPGETQNVTYNFALPKYAEAGLYTVNMKVVDGADTREKIRSFSVARQADFSRESVRQPTLFGFRKIITVTNTGNLLDDAVVADTVSPIDASFFSGEEPVSRADGQFTWLLKNIQPGEARRLVYYIDYSPAVLFIAVVAIASWVFFFRLRTLRIKKYILERKFIEQGEEFTVGVEVMNMSGSKVESATVKDFVPSVFEIKDAEGPKPSQRKVAAGTELTWHVKDLHKNEERILSYKIIPVFGIHGTIRLPRSSIKYRAGKKEVETRSFYASIGIEMENYRDKKGKK